MISSTFSSPSSTSSAWLWALATDRLEPSKSATPSEAKRLNVCTNGSEVEFCEEGSRRIDFIGFLWSHRKAQVVK